MDGYAEIGVLYNEPETYGVRLHKVPRELFDLIPGKEHTVDAGIQRLWTKTMMLAREPGKHIKFIVFCEEPSPIPPPHPSPVTG